MRDHTSRNGRVMPFTSADGAGHPESFWAMDSIVANVGQSSLTVGFVGYHSAAAYDEGRLPMAGAEKHYTVSGEGFTAIVGTVPEASGVPLAALLTEAAWDVALSIKDEGEGEEKVSFFEAAQSVTPPVGGEPEGSL